MAEIDPLDVVRSSKQSQPGKKILARSCFAALVFFVLLSGVYFAHKSGTNAEVYSNDFNVYYHAAKEVLAGRDPYQKSLGEWTPYLYPTLLAELLVPLAMLPLPIAAYLWFLIGAASMFSAARMSAWMSATLLGERREEYAEKDAQRGVRLPSWRAAIAAAAVVVVLRFVLDTFDMGQVNTIVTGLAVAHIYFYARDKKALSAIALVFAISIKLTPALFLVYHIAKMRLKFAAACFSILLGVTALSFLPFEAHGLEAFRIFADRTLKNGQGYNLADSGNQSLRGAIARLAGSASDGDSGGTESRSPADAVTFAIAIVLLSGAVFAARRARSELAGAAPFFCCVVLLSPLSWKAHFVILVLPTVYLLFQAKTSANARRALLFVIVASFALFNLTSPHVVGLAAAEWADAHSLVSLGALLIFVATLALNIGKFGKQPRVC
jgi:alpha-1,2-mannosyltransferase